MKKLLLSVDAGKNSVKVKCKKIKFKFENLVLEDKVTKKPSNSFSFEVNFDESRFVVGNKVKTLKDYSSNKVTESNKIAIYTAIAKVLQDLNLNEIEIKLVTGLPNEHYSETNEENLKKLLAGEVHINIDGLAKSFVLKEADILVLPENYSVDYETIPRTLLLDLGYRNTNINLLEFGDMLPKYMKHSELGILEMKNRIAEELEKIGNNHFNEEDITDHIIINGLPHNEKSKEAIKIGIETHFKQLTNEFQSKGINLETIEEIALRGGGTKLIKLEHLKTVYPDHHANNNIHIEGDEFKNVEIFEAVGEQFFEDEMNE